MGLAGWIGGRLGISRGSWTRGEWVSVNMALSWLSMGDEFMIWVVICAFLLASVQFGVTGRVVSR